MHATPFTYLTHAIVVFVCNSHQAAANCLHKHSTYIMHKMATMKSLYVVYGICSTLLPILLHTQLHHSPQSFTFLWGTLHRIYVLWGNFYVCVFLNSGKGRSCSRCWHKAGRRCVVLIPSSPSSPFPQFFGIKTIFHYALPPLILLSLFRTKTTLHLLYIYESVLRGSFISRKGRRRRDFRVYRCPRVARSLQSPFTRTESRGGGLAKNLRTLTYPSDNQYYAGCWMYVASLK